MPTAYVAKLAKKHNMSVLAAEAKWNKAKAVAVKEGKTENFAYITSIFKKMMKESVFDGGFKQFLSLTENHEETYDHAPAGDKFSFGFGDTDTEALDDQDMDDQDMDDQDMDDQDMDDQDMDDQDLEGHDDHELDDQDLEGHDGHELDDILGPDEMGQQEGEDDFDDEDQDVGDDQDTEFNPEDDFNDGSDLDRYSENDETFSFMKSLLSEGKKKKSLKKAAKSVYHRDYEKTKDRDYRKYHPEYKERADEGIMDYLRGAGQEVGNKARQAIQPLKDVHAAGQKNSLNMEIRKSIFQLADTINKYRQLKAQLSGNPTNEGIMDYLRGAGQEVGNKARQVGQQVRDVHQAGQMRSKEAEVQKLIQLSNQQFSDLVRLINKGSTTSMWVVKSTLRELPRGVMLAIAKKLKGSLDPNMVGDNTQSPTKSTPRPRPGIQARYSR